MSDEGRKDRGVTRLSFLKASAGAAAGAAVVGVPAAVVAGQDKAVETAPSTKTPREPLMAYVRDAKRGEVTIVSGTTETTYRDQVLVKRLLAAAPSETLSNGGGINVVAP